MNEAATLERQLQADAGESLAAGLPRLPGDARVATARAALLDEFRLIGLPHRRIEAWKYTDLRARLKDVAPPATAPDAWALAKAKAAIDGVIPAEGLRLVLVDGFVVAELSSAALADGVHVLTLGAFLGDSQNEARADLLRSAVDDPIVTLNAALASDGVILSIGDGVTVSEPIHLVHVATQNVTSTHARSFLRLGDGASVAIAEHVIALGNVQMFDTLVAGLGAQARLDLVHIAHEPEQAARVSSKIVTLAERAALNTFNMAAGGGLCRAQGFVRFAGEGAQADINGAALLDGRQHMDMTLFLDHVAPGCMSRENYHAVLEGEARSVFQGQIVVRDAAQKTDAKMMARALLLSDLAEADHKPELEIYADDVQCGHGATAGALDENLLFYLRARGLSERDAQAMLIRAFVNEVIDKIAHDKLRELVAAAADRELERRA